MSNEIQIHDYSIKRYGIMPRSKVIIKKFSTKYKSHVLDDYWDDLSKEQKEKYSKDWKMCLHDKTQYSIQLARKHILKHYIKQIKELQEKIIDEHTIVHKRKHVAPSKKYEELCSELRLLLNHIINRSTTHVADFIVVVTKYKKVRYGCLIDGANKINLMGIKQSCLIDKVTDRKFMEANFAIEFMEELVTSFHPDGFCTNWICQGKNSTGYESSRALVFTDLKMASSVSMRMV